MTRIGVRQACHEHLAASVIQRNQIRSTETQIPMRTIRILPLLAAALLAVTGCSRIDALLPGSSLENMVGQWLLTYPAEGDAHTEMRMTFAEDGSYSSELLWIGFYGLPADEVTGYWRTWGEYRMEGDRLMVRLTRSEQWQKYAAGPNPSVTTPEPVWGDRGTVDVDGNRLIHTYVSAPADAEETFVEVYRRER